MWALVNVWSAVVGGLAGTLVLTTILRGATELRLTRVDLPFLLGTAVTPSRQLAKVIGYAAHFVFGALFSLGITSSSSPWTRADRCWAPSSAWHMGCSPARRW